MESHAFFIVGVVQWEESLRKYPWFPTPGVPLKPPWDDGSNDKPKPVARPEDIAPDRVGRADRDNPKFEYFKDRWAHLKKGEDDWGAWEKFCFKMAAAIARAEPHYPDFVNPPEFGGLLVRTLSISPDCLLLYRFAANASGFLP